MTSAARIAAGRFVIAVLVGLAVGAFTAYGQGWLGDSFGSLVNSAGPWSVAAFLVARMSRSIWVGALTAAITLAMCELGYVLANNIRDVPSSRSTIVFWLTAALLAGPPLGVAGVWSRHESKVRAAVGWGVISGVLIGEGTYGLARLTNTTNSTYWLVELVLGVALLTVVLIRLRSVHAALAGAGVAAVAAGTVLAAALVA